MSFSAIDIDSNVMTELLDPGIDSYENNFFDQFLMSSPQDSLIELSNILNSSLNEEPTEFTAAVLNSTFDSKLLNYQDDSRSFPPKQTVPIFAAQEFPADCQPVEAALSESEPSHSDDFAFHIPEVFKYDQDFLTPMPESPTVERQLRKQLRPEYSSRDSTGSARKKDRALNQVRKAISSPNFQVTRSSGFECWGGKLNKPQDTFNIEHDTFVLQPASFEYLPPSPPPSAEKVQKTSSSYLQKPIPCNLAKPRTLTGSSAYDNPHEILSRGISRSNWGDLIVSNVNQSPRSELPNPDFQHTLHSGQIAEITNQLPLTLDEHLDYADLCKQKSYNSATSHQHGVDIINGNQINIRIPNCSSGHDDDGTSQNCRDKPVVSKSHTTHTSTRTRCYQGKTKIEDIFLTDPPRHLRPQQKFTPIQTSQSLSKSTIKNDRNHRSTFTPLVRKCKSSKCLRPSTPRTGNSTLDFVNYTPSDSLKILTGVAPSGSSKTKARREREALEKRNKLSQAALRAVRAAGGDVTRLLEEGFLDQE